MVKVPPEVQAELDAYLDDYAKALEAGLDAHFSKKHTEVKTYPASFDNCVAQGGRVRTVSINEDEYIHVCYLDGKSHPGEVKTKKKHAANEKEPKDVVDYRDGRGDRRCENCTMFIAPDRCDSVIGIISPEAVCDLFKRKAGAHEHYSPDQPRIPAGTPDGGQFAPKDAGGGGGTATVMPPGWDDGTMAQVIFDKNIREKLAADIAKAQNLPKTNFINTPERNQMRADIVDKLYGDGAATKGREAWIVTGMPASGKNSSLAEPLAEDHGAMIIDADEVKKEIPEFAGGIGANAVHEESAEIILPKLLERAVVNGDNIVMPRVGKTYSSLVNDIGLLKSAGYKVHLNYLHTDEKVAMQRAVSRYLNTGRLVSLSYIKSVDGNPEKAYQQAKAEGIADSYARYDNTTTAKGERARRVE